jgi:putative flippase GtrA
MAFGRYLLVGIAATGVHYLILLAMVESAGCPAWISAAAGSIVGAIVAYAGNWHFTFLRSAQHVQALPRFLLVAGWGAGANGLIVWLGATQLGLHYLLAQAIATLVVVVLTFQVNRIWTFS